MKFDTRIWHPNVSSQTGAICLDILKDNWSPALTIKTALLSLQALLSTPEPNDPQDAEVANMYLSDIDTFRRTAKFWTETYAITRDENVNAQIQRLCEMGFETAAAEQALTDSNGNEEEALELLLTA